MYSLLEDSYTMDGTFYFLILTSQALRNWKEKNQYLETMELLACYEALVTRDIDSNV